MCSRLNCTLSSASDFSVWSAVKIKRSMAAAEPVLLIGDTGSGKTTACQLAAALRGLPLVTVSCSRFTEAADFVGGYRPVR